MDDIILKNYTLKYNPEDPNYIFFIPNPNIYYKCSEFAFSTGFDYIHKIVMKTREHPEALNVLKDYLDKFPNKINCINDSGWTPLHLACRNSNADSTEETVWFLLSHPKIDVNLRVSHGRTALHLACQNSNTDSTEITVEILLSHPNTNVNLQDESGKTALILACENSDFYSTEITVEILLSYSSQEHHRCSLQDELRSSNINVNLQDKNGQTALHWACRFNHIKAVEMLLKYKLIN